MYIWVSVEQKLIMRNLRIIQICALSVIYAGGVRLNSKEKGARKYLWPYYQAANILENVAPARPSLALEFLDNFFITSLSPAVSREGTFLDLERGANDTEMKLPEIVQANDPVLRKYAQEVDVFEIRSQKVQKIIDDMICVMKKRPWGISLSAPQIGIPLRIIVLENKKAYTSYAAKEVIKDQERRPFDQLVILNPKLHKKSNRTISYTENCNSVAGVTAKVERCREVEVTGLDHNGDPIMVIASGWQAVVLQHECDHLDGTLFVDKMVPGTLKA